MIHSEKKLPELRQVSLVLYTTTRQICAWEAV